MPNTSVRFYLADDVRSESSGKVTLVGLYPDNVLVLGLPTGTASPSPQNALGISAVAVLSTIQGDPGLCEAVFKLTDPHGRVMIQSAEPAPILVGKERHANLIARFPAFVVTGFGTYKFELQIGDQVHVFPIEVKQGDAQRVDSTAMRRHETLPVVAKKKVTKPVAKKRTAKA